MAPIIDALVVTFGLDASEFKKEQEQARESLDNVSILVKRPIHF